MLEQGEIMQDLFNIKQKFLQIIPHPKLILKQINLIHIKEGNLDSFPIDYTGILLPPEIENEKLADFLNKHIKTTLSLKHNIAMAANYAELKSDLLQMYTSQIVLLKKLKLYLEIGKNYADQAVKMSDPIDSYLLLKTIQQLNLEENEIKNYLCEQIKKEELDQNKISVHFLRANKIINHG